MFNISDRMSLSANVNILALTVTVKDPAGFISR